MDRHLTEEERAQIVHLYEERLATLGGEDVRTVGWGSRESQTLRFRELTRNVALRGRRILDVGCGLGDLVPFLDQQTDGAYAYVGIDISPGLVESAQTRFGGEHRQFLAGDILQMADLEPADVVLMSGALSFRIEENRAFAETMLRRMFALSREVLAVNFLSSYVDYQLEKNFHYKPEQMFSFAKSLTPWVTLLHDYPLWEFTLQMRTHSRTRNEDR